MNFWMKIVRSTKMLFILLDTFILARKKLYIPICTQIFLFIVIFSLLGYYTFLVFAHLFIFSDFKCIFTMFSMVSHSSFFTSNKFIDFCEFFWWQQKSFDEENHKRNSVADEKEKEWCLDIAQRKWFTIFANILCLLVVQILNECVLRLIIP